MYEHTQTSSFDPVDVFTTLSRKRPRSDERQQGKSPVHRQWLPPRLI